MTSCCNLEALGHLHEAEKPRLYRVVHRRDPVSIRRVCRFKKMPLSGLLVTGKGGWLRMQHVKQNKTAISVYLWISRQVTLIKKNIRKYIRYSITNPCQDCFVSQSNQTGQTPELSRTLP